MRKYLIYRLYRNWIVLVGFGVNEFEKCDVLEVGNCKKYLIKIWVFFFDCNYIVVYLNNECV